MNSGYAILIIICLVALYSILINLKAIGDVTFPSMRFVCTLLFAFSALRYVTLIIYGDMPSYAQMMALRRFYFATSIGLTLTTASAIWYITPSYREKTNYLFYLALFIPWITFYIYLIVKQPTQIMQGKSFGYVLTLIKPFPIYLGIAQGSFIGVMVLLGIIGIINYKNIQIRALYLSSEIGAKMHLKMDPL